MKYDGSGRRISKTRWVKKVGAQDWEKELVTHYTGIGMKVREEFHNDSLEKAKVVVNMSEGLGRYGVEDAKGPDMGFGAGYIPNTKFEWYLKNHLGSTMPVYGTGAGTPGGLLAAYDYRSFGEQVNLVSSNNGVDKVTENFTGKEHDEEIKLNYFGARYLDPMLGMWVSVDPKRQFASPYLYAGNGVNPVNGVDEEGEDFMVTLWKYAPNKKLATGVTIYQTGTPDKPGEVKGQWLSHSGGVGTAMKPGKYEVGSHMYDVSKMRDPSTRGWKSCAYDIYKEGCDKALVGPGGHKVMFHNDDPEPTEDGGLTGGYTHGCHGVIDGESYLDGFTTQGNLPDLIKNSGQDRIPLIIEEYKDGN